MPKEGAFSFFKGEDDLVEPIFGATEDVSQNWDAAAKKVNEAIAGALGAQHLSFLLGSGCSSFLDEEGNEVGIPTMSPLARDFVVPEREYDGLSLPAEDIARFRDDLGIDLSHETVATNLERLMELLQALEFAYRSEALAHDDDNLDLVTSTIDLTQQYIAERCELAERSEGDVLALYMAFYRKLVYREQSLPSPWVFTTNYDLFNERSLDRLGIPICNGFTGALEKRFNPATFRYSLAEQMDISSRKWTAVDSYTYLVKLHGSINWGEDDLSLYPIREYSDARRAAGKRLMIYPHTVQTERQSRITVFRSFQRIPGKNRS